MSIIELLESISKNVRNSFDHINRGGCGVFASIVASELQQIGFNCNLRIITWDEYEYDFPNNLTTKNVHQCAPILSINHVIVEVFDEENEYPIYFDSDGIINKKHGKIQPLSNNFIEDYGSCLYKKPVDLSVMDELIECYEWNTTFDRSQIPQMKGTIKRLFNVFNISKKARYHTA